MPDSAPAPRGVRVRYADGTSAECDVLRDADQDRDGCAYWIAVPREGPVDVAGARLEVDDQPQGSIIAIRGQARHPD